MRVIAWGLAGKGTLAVWEAAELVGIAMSCLC